MAVVFTWYESDSDGTGGGTLVDAGNPVIFGEIAKGDEGLPEDEQMEPLHLWNDKDGAAAAPTATGLTISCVAASGDPLHPMFLGTDSNGNVSIIQARSRGSYNCSDDAQESWTPIGPTQHLAIGDIPRSAMRMIEVRIQVPPDMDDAEVEEFELQINYS